MKQGDDDEASRRAWMMRQQPPPHQPPPHQPPPHQPPPHLHTAPHPASYGGRSPPPPMGSHHHHHHRGDVNGMSQAAAAASSASSTAAAWPYPPPSTGEHGRDDDVVRGLSIDFYGIPDPRLCASWASFFRDQYIEYSNRVNQLTSDNRHVQFLCDVHRLIRDVTTEVIPTDEMTELFHKIPFVPPEQLDPERMVPKLGTPFADSCFKIIFLRLGGRGEHPLDNGVYHGRMWFQHDLGLILQKAHERERNKYASTIRAITDAMLREISQEQQRDQTIHTLYSASGRAMDDDNAYKSAIALYAIIYQVTHPDDDHHHHSHQQHCYFSPIKLTNNTKRILHNRRIRDFFSLEEEAFILVVLRKHLFHRFGEDKLATNDTSKPIVTPGKLFAPQDHDAFNSVRRVLAVQEPNDMASGGEAIAVFRLHEQEEGDELNDSASGAADDESPCHEPLKKRLKTSDDANDDIIGEEQESAENVASV